MSDYWTAIDTLHQVAGELGLAKPATITGLQDIQSVQLLALLNSAGNELLMYYTWSQFRREWAFETVPNVGSYTVPSDWLYFLDQTQWDRTNRWPLLGPKSAQEWAWLKGSLVAALPRQRFRVVGDQFLIWPTPVGTTAPFTFAMEYMSRNWVINSSGQPASMIYKDGDIIQFNPWLMIKFVKMKFYELKGFQTDAVQGDFLRVFNSLTGQDTGAAILSLTPGYTNQYLGYQSVPDGSWNVAGT